jgi:hypothetical protein
MNHKCAEVKKPEIIDHIILLVHFARFYFLPSCSCSFFAFSLVIPLILWHKISLLRSGRNTEIHSAPAATGLEYSTVRLSKQRSTELEIAGQHARNKKKKKSSVCYAFFAKYAGQECILDWSVPCQSRSSRIIMLLEIPESHDYNFLQSLTPTCELMNLWSKSDTSAT